MSHHWLDTTEYPFASKYYFINGQRLHYIDEGQGEVVLFVHGTPSWSFDFRNIIKPLRATHRCIAIDHMGFGLSDKPKDYDYSTVNHSLTLEKFVLDHNLQNITLVVHDFGGPIGLNVAMRHPDRIKKIVILNSWLWSSKTDLDFIKFSKILKSPLLPFLYLYLNFSPKFILPKSFGDHKLPAHLLKQYTRPFANKNQRYGALAFARSLLNDQEWFEELWNKKQAIAAKPALLLWGMKDAVIKPHYLEKFRAGFRNATTVQLTTSGHFPQEEQSMTVLNELKRFLDRD